MKQLNFLDKNAINPLTTVGGAIAMKTQKLNVIFKSFRGLALVAFVLLGVSSLSAASQAYTFTAENWAATPANWTSGKDGYGFTNNGIQVTTGVTGAKGTSPISFDNVGDVVVTYCTNSSKGKGTIKVSVGANEIATTAVTTTGGTTPRTLTFPGGGTYSGNITIEVACTTNSIYIIGTTINYTPEALPSYTLTWNVNGSTYTTTEVQGAIGTLPPDPASSACDGSKVFVGWTDEPYTHASVAPTYISTATVPSGNTTYYAVFATETAGGSSEQVLCTETFESYTASTTYNGTQNYTGTAPLPSWKIYYGTVSTTAALSGSKSAHMRWYSSAPSNLPYIQTTTKLTAVTKFSFKILTSDNDYKYDVSYSEDGNIWTSVAVNQSVGSTSATQSKEYIISATGKDVFIKVAISSAANVTDKATFRIDDVAFYSMQSGAITYSDYTTSCCTAITPTLSYSASVNVGQTLNPTLGGNDGSGTVTYSSSDISVLTVNSSTGEVTGVSAGTAKVTANIAANDGYCAGSVESSTITVSSGCTPATASFTLGTVNKTFGDANFTNTFTSNNTGAKTYSSSNTGVATVNSTTGEVTIVGVGTTTISVTQPETSGICAVSTNYTLNVACATLATPTGFTAGTVAATTIDLSWTAVPNASSYTIEYTAGSTQTKSGITGTSTQLTGLTPSTAYSITIQAIGNGTTYCSSAKSGAINVSTTAIPTYTLTWNVNGTTSTTTVNQGDAIGTLPATPASCSATYSTFVGWYTVASGSESSLQHLLLELKLLRLLSQVVTLHITLCLLMQQVVEVGLN